MEKIYCFGELLWDMLPSGKQAGGAPMNVAYHLNRLGLETKPITAIGKDALGKELMEFLKSKNISTDFVLENAQPTGQVVVTLSKSNEASYTIQAPAAWDFIELNKDSLLEIAQKEYLLILFTFDVLKGLTAAQKAYVVPGSIVELWIRPNETVGTNVPLAVTGGTWSFLRHIKYAVPTLTTLA